MDPEVVLAAVQRSWQAFQHAPLEMSYQLSVAPETYVALALVYIVAVH